MVQTTRVLKSILMHSCIVASLLLSGQVMAECSDRESMEKADAGSKAFLGDETEIFQRAVVLKRHHPGYQKEVASYAKAGGQFYTMFFIIDPNCKAFFIKRAGPR